MKRTTLAVLVLGVSVVSLGAFMFWTTRTDSSPSAPVAAAKTAAAEPTPTPARPMSMDEWIERRASGDPDVPSVPPTIDAILSSFDLDPALWEKYEGQSVETLDQRIGELKAKFATLQQETAKLKEEHSQLARVEPKKADQLMHDKVLPIFEERDRLLGETLLAVNAKAFATDSAPVMPSELRVR